MKRNRSIFKVAPLAAMLAAMVLALDAHGADAGEMDWSAVAERTVPMFQPGQGSWEWLLIPGNHGAGARRMREGRTCLSCHEGEEQTIGGRIGSGQVLEPAPMQGMPGSFDVALAVAHDGENLHVRLSWPVLTGTAPPGDSDVAARVTLMLGSEALPVAHVAGCWASCHNDLRDMPDAHPEQLTKYLPNSRVRLTATGGGTDLRSDAELAEERSSGRYLEYWQVELDTEAAVEPVDGYFLEARHTNDSAAVTASARRSDGHWIVEMARPMAAPGGTRKDIERGMRYTLAIAIHENHYTHRHHYVSFPLDLMLDTGEADLIVTQP
jgi:hypothetical protein